MWIPALFIFSLATAQALNSSVLGNWANPSGSVIHIYRCGTNLCAKLIAISASAPTRVDANNPDPALRRRSLCGLEIGTGFQPAGPGRAQGGRLYDPKSGKTYTGSMTRDGNQLKLRGYVGVPLFGRTETWTRAPNTIAACRP
jgi:uncharacterized protein (DUF2147 family)